ncbi:MAG: hypothetical protein CMF49_02635 [Legionellales bacterium]|nr:hypothetical protein [Legionellales bacterium]
MLIDISGLDKAQVLIALFNNAKHSTHCWDTIGSMFCSEDSMRRNSAVKDFYDEKINAVLQTVNLTYEEASTLIKKTSVIKDKVYIKHVKLPIDFREDIIDCTEYNKMHHDVDNAWEVLKKLGAKQSWESKYISSGESAAFSSTYSSSRNTSSYYNAGTNTFGYYKTSGNDISQHKCFKASEEPGILYTGTTISMISDELIERFGFDKRQCVRTKDGIYNYITIYESIELADENRNTQMETKTLSPR